MNFSVVFLNERLLLILDLLDEEDDDLDDESVEYLVVRLI